MRDLHHAQQGLCLRLHVGHADQRDLLLHGGHLTLQSTGLSASCCIRKCVHNKGWLSGNPNALIGVMRACLTLAGQPLLSAVNRPVLHACHLQTAATGPGSGHSVADRADAAMGCRS